MIESWKSVHITGVFPINQTRQSQRTLRSDTQSVLRTNEKIPDSFLAKAAKLWKMASHRFRTTNLLKVAKMEAMTIAKTLPI